MANADFENIKHLRNPVTLSLNVPFIRLVNKTNHICMIIFPWGKYNLALYITTRSIYNIAVAEERMPGSSVLLRWWDQAMIQLGELYRADDELDLAIVEYINLTIT